jgi:ubiquinone/menaquinone biosynthesis C-methylase UbiE
MKKPILISPDDGTLLINKGDNFISKKGKKYPIIKNIPHILPRNIKTDSWKNDTSTQFGEWSKKKNQFLLNIRFKEIMKHVKGKPKNVLDVGCGDGDLIEQLLKKCTQVCVGVDMRTNLKQTPQKNIIKADAENLPFKDNYFDYVIMAAVLEHLPHPSEAIKEAFRVLKKDGYIIITTPNPLYHKLTDIAAFLKLKYKEGLETPISLAKSIVILKKYNFKVVFKKRFLFFPFKLPFYEGLDKFFSPFLGSLNFNQIIIGKK